MKGRKQVFSGDSELIILSLGSNMGDRFVFLHDARRLISDEIGTVGMMSSIYETEPWGKGDQAFFLNQIVTLNTDLKPEKFLEQIRSMELRLGRKRHEKMGPRTIDIDILFFGNRIISGEELVIPHPSISDRRFVLLPLSEILPDFEHPELKKTINQLLRSCRDPLKVKLFKP